MSAPSSSSSPVRLVAVALVLALTGCARALPPPHEPVDEPARRLVALLAERWHGFSDLRTLADVRIQRGSERQRLTGVLLARAPSSVRVEALSPLGSPLLIVTMHDGQLVAYNTATNEGLVGPATADTAARLLSLPFDPDDLVGVLAGRPVPPKDLRRAEILAADEHGPSVELIGGVNRLRVWMDFASGVVRQVELTGGRYEARVTYRLRDDGRPEGFDLTAAQGQFTGAVAYRDPVFDGGVDTDRFSLKLPEAAKIERLR